MRQLAHETLDSEEIVNRSSERSFGILIGSVLALIAAINWWHDGHIWPELGVIAVIFFGLAWLWQAPLKPLNRLWFKFGLLLHAIVNPVIMALLFYGAVLPTGVVMRALGKDLLNLKKRPDSDSYWIMRRPPGPKPETMKDQ